MGTWGGVRAPLQGTPRAVFQWASGASTYVKRSLIEKRGHGQACGGDMGTRLRLCSDSRLPLPFFSPPSLHEDSQDGTLGLPWADQTQQSYRQLSTCWPVTAKDMYPRCGICPGHLPCHQRTRTSSGHLM